MTNPIRPLAKSFLNRVGYHLVPVSPLHNGKISRDLLDDSFVKSLRTALGGWLCDDNVVVFEQAIRTMPAGGAVVEIGSYLGLSTSILAHALQKYAPETPLFNCDIWQYAQETATSAELYNRLHTVENYQEWVRESFQRNMRTFTKKLPHSFCAFSDDFFDSWNQNAVLTDIFGHSKQLGGAISFAYIDGDHGYDAAHKDFFNIDRHLLIGGIVLLDDSSFIRQYLGVHRVLDEIHATKRYELIADRHNRAFVKRS